MLPRILVIDHDPNAVEQVQRALEAEGYQVLTATTGLAGIALAQMQRPGLVLLEIDLPDIDGYEACRALRGTPSTAKLPILIYSAKAEVANKVAGFQAGANDYIVKSTDTAELIARIKAALRPEEQPSAHVVALWGSKGGVGTTTVASNLAVALRAKTDKRVTLVDASVMAGTLGVVLNLAPQHTLVDLLSRLDDLDSELLRSVLTKHSSGIRVLLSAPWSSNGSSMQPEHIERILFWLQEASDYIVLDTAPSLDQSTLAVLQLADQVLIVLTPEMTSLRNARLFLKMVEGWGPTTDKFVLTLSRYPVKGGVTVKDIEAGLQMKVGVEIANDEALATYSINRGIPLVISHPRSAVAQSFYQLADVVIARAEHKRRVLTKTSAPIARL